nr:transporter substrate-binding domain-containing protein [uncultured Lachnoclostridium sp.]
MKRRMIAGFLVAMMTAGLVAGCGSSDNSGESAESEETTADSAQTIVVACSNAAEPYSFVEDDEHKGFEVDMWNEIAERTGYEVTMETMGFSSIFGSLDSGMVDVAGNFFGKTDERLEKYDASISYGEDGVGVAVLADNTDINSLADLNGKTVAVGEGTQGQAVAESVSSEYGFTTSVFGDGTSGVQDLSLGRTDAWMDSRITLSFDSNKAGVDVRILDESLSSTEVGYFFRKDDEESAKKLEDVNAALEDMLADGTIKELSEKWMFIDVTAELAD